MDEIRLFSLGTHVSELHTLATISHASRPLAAGEVLAIGDTGYKIIEVVNVMTDVTPAGQRMPTLAAGMRAYVVLPVLLRCKRERAEKGTLDGSRHAV